MVTRRHALAACSGVATALVAGCLTGQTGSGPGGTVTQTESCSATDPPAPTDAATDPKPYPDRPENLTADTVKPFLESYATAYQYNDALAENPDKIGRLNSISVYVESVAVESTDGGFTATVTGQLNSNIIDNPSTTTPETRTETPLPMGHGPFEASYVVSDRRLEREGITVECW